jgi:hypothetical protein
MSVLQKREREQDETQNNTKKGTSSVTPAKAEGKQDLCKVTMVWQMGVGRDH